MDFREVCRTCLVPSESVSPGDNDYPDNICCDCFDKVRQSYNFKLKFEKSASILNQLKVSGRSMNEAVKSLDEYEHTEEYIELIKTENIEDYDSPNDDRIESTNTSTFQQVLVKQEISLVQEVKQEAEIEINMEKGEFDEGTTNPRKYKCATCSKLFRYKCKLEEHIRIHTGEKPFRCEVCPNTFQSKSNLNRHIRKIHGVQSQLVLKLKPEKFRCATCSKLFGYKSRLDEHMRIHTKEAPFRCIVCPKKYRSKSNLTSHIQSMHKLQPLKKIIIRKLKCPTCSKLFGYRSSLLEHMKIHTGEKPFQCGVCPVKYRYRGNLKRHVQTTHTDTDILLNSIKFQCATCSKLFESKARLNEHMRIHTGEKPFQCEVCSKKYRFKTSLAEHMYAKHADRMTNTAKFTCKICSKLCRRKSKFDEHMRIHSGEKPFQCKVCLIKFRIKGSLKKHLQKTHADITQ